MLNPGQGTCSCILCFCHPVYQSCVEMLPNACVPSSNMVTSSLCNTGVRPLSSRKCRAHMRLQLCCTIQHLQGSVGHHAAHALQLCNLHAPCTDQHSPGACLQVKCGLASMQWPPSAFTSLLTLSSSKVSPVGFTR